MQDNNNKTEYVAELTVPLQLFYERLIHLLKDWVAN